MQILHQDRAHGRIKLIPNTLDDLWHLYQIISLGDIVEGSSSRRIRPTASDTSRPDKGERKHVFLSLIVENIDFHEFSDALRIKGTIQKASDNTITLGSYHTFNVTVPTTISITKDHWSKLQVSRLQKAVADTKKAKLGILAIEEGLSQLATVTNIGINPGPSITLAIPGKRGKAAEHDKVFAEFLADVSKLLYEYNEQKQPGKLLIVGPGSTKNALMKVLQKNYPHIAQKSLLETVSSGTIQGVNEAIRRGKLLERISELDVLENTKIMQQVLSHIGKDTGLVTYGEQDVNKAIRQGAVEELLVSETNLRVATPSRRKTIERIVHSAESIGAKVHFMSPLYPAGKQLESLGGLAAILRFRIRT